MSWLGAILAVAILELAGAAVLTLLSDDIERRPVAERLGLAFGAGLVTMSLTLFLSSLAGLTPSPWIGTAAAAAFGGLAIAARPRQARAWVRPIPRPPGDRGWTAGQALLVALLVALFLSFTAASVLEPAVEWDVIAVWSYKAEILLREPVLGSAYFHDAAKAYSHLDYPLLWPFAMSWIWAWVGRPDFEAVKVLAPALLLALIGSFYGLARRGLDRTGALLFTSLFAGLPFLLSQTSRLMADAPLALFVLLAFGSLAASASEAGRDDLRRAGLFSAGLLFTKNEGIALFGILAAAGGALAAFRRDARLARAVLVWIVALPVAATSAWLVFRAGIPKLHEDYGGRLGIALLLRNAGRFPEVARGFVRYALETPDWLAFWPLAAVAPLLGRRRLARPGALILAGALLATLAVYAGIFVISPWAVPELLESAAARLLLHVAPLAALLAAFCAADAPARRD